MSQSLAIAAARMVNCWALRELRKEKNTWHLAAIRLQSLPRWTLKKLRMWKHMILAPDSWGMYQRQDFGEPRCLQLPIHRKVLNSLTWYIWFDFIYNFFFGCSDYLPFVAKITTHPSSFPFLLEKFLRALWKVISWTVLCLVAQHVWLCAAPWTVDCQAPLSMGIHQARILEWVAMPPRLSFRESSQPRECLPHCRWILYHLSHQGSPRILQWVAYPFPRGSSRPRNWIGVSCIADEFLTSWATKETPNV